MYNDWAYVDLLKNSIQDLLDNSKKQRLQKRVKREFNLTIKTVFKIIATDGQAGPVYKEQLRDLIIEIAKDYKCPLCQSTFKIGKRSSYELDFDKDFVICKNCNTYLNIEVLESLDGIFIMMALTGI